MPVVKMLFKNILHHFRCDRIRFVALIGIKLPSPFLEEVENLEQRTILNLDIRICGFQMMNLENASSYIGNSSILFQLGGISAGVIKHFMKKGTQKPHIERE